MVILNTTLNEELLNNYRKEVYNKVKTKRIRNYYEKCLNKLMEFEYLNNNVNDKIDAFLINEFNVSNVNVINIKGKTNYQKTSLRCLLTLKEYALTGNFKKIMTYRKNYDFLIEQDVLNDNKVPIFKNILSDIYYEQKEIEKCLKHVIHNIYDNHNRNLYYLEREFPVTSYLLGRQYVDTKEERTAREGFFVGVFASHVGSWLIDTGELGAIVISMLFALCCCLVIARHERTSFDIATVLMLFTLGAVPTFGIFYYRYYSSATALVYVAAGGLFLFSKVDFVWHSTSENSETPEIQDT